MKEIKNTIESFQHSEYNNESEILASEIRWAFDNLANG